MSFNDDARLDTSQVETRSATGGGAPGVRFPGGLAAGGGLGGVLVLALVIVLAFVTGGTGTGADAGTVLDSGGLGNSISQVATTGAVDESVSQCRTGADANRSDVCLVVATVNSVQSFWAAQLPRYGERYTAAKTVLYAGATQTACGLASNDVGPFYCPADGLVYLDVTFFAELTSRFGASGGQLAKEYVIAHEYGHHIQDLLGLLPLAQRDPQGADSGSVRSELQADCFAGVWANHAAATTDTTGTTLLRPLTATDISDALSAAASVGDDRIQAAVAGSVTPESFTHGTSAQRLKWFLTGYQSGDLTQCQTFGSDVNLG